MNLFYLKEKCPFFCSYHMLVHNDAPNHSHSNLLHGDIMCALLPNHNVGDKQVDTSRVLNAKYSLRDPSDSH